MPEMEITPGLEEDPRLGLSANVGDRLQTGYLLQLVKDENGDYTGLAQVYFPYFNDIRDNIHFSIPSGITRETFMGMLSDHQAVTLEKTGGQLNVKNPIIVVVGFMPGDVGVILAHFPLDYRLYTNTFNKPLRKIKKGEPYIKGKSKASLHFAYEQDAAGNISASTTTFRLDDTLSDDDPNQMLIQVDQNRDVKINNIRNLEVMASGDSSVKVAGASSVEIEGNSEIKVAGDANLEVTGSTTVKSSQVTLDSSNIIMGLGAMYRVAIAELIALAHNKHTHLFPPTGGAPTSPPVVPVTAETIGSTVAKAK